MGVLKKIEGYWLKPAFYFDVALIRILLVLLQLFILLNTYSTFIYRTELPLELFKPIPLFQLFLVPLGLDTPPSAEFIIGLFWVGILFGGAALFGLFTNVTLLIFALINFFLNSFKFSFGDLHHPEAVMALMMFMLAIAPSGKVLSLDYFINRFRHRNDPSFTPEPLLQAKGPYAAVPILFMQWFFPMMYLSAVISKLHRSGLDWANGFTLQYYMIMDYFRNGSDLALFAAQNHYMIMFSQVVVLIFQATFWLIIPFPKLRWFYLPLGLFFHGSIYLMLRAPFPQWMSMYIVYIPWALVLTKAATSNVYLKTNPS